MAYCRRCGKRYPDEELSNRGLCGECITKRVQDSAQQMIDKKGPMYRKYQAGLARSRKRAKEVKELVHGAAERAPADQ